MVTEIISLVDPDADEPVTLEEVKNYLRITPENNKEDSIIENLLIPSARQTVERYLNIDILGKDRHGFLPELRGDYFSLHYAPIHLQKGEVLVATIQHSQLAPNRKSLTIDGVSPNARVLHVNDSIRIQNGGDSSRSFTKKIKTVEFLQGHESKVTFDEVVSLADTQVLGRSNLDPILWSQPDTYYGFDSNVVTGYSRFDDTKIFGDGNLDNIDINELLNKKVLIGYTGAHPQRQPDVIDFFQATIISVDASDGNVPEIQLSTNVPRTVQEAGNQSLWIGTEDIYNLYKVVDDDEFNNFNLRAKKSDYRTAITEILIEGQDYVIEGGRDIKIYPTRKFYQYELIYQTAGIKSSDPRFPSFKMGILALISEMYRERDGRYMDKDKSNWRDWLRLYSHYGYFGTS